MTAHINDLRSALVFLKTHGESVTSCSQPLNPKYELASHYVAHSASVPATSRSGNETMIQYTQVAGHTMPVLMGLFGSRRRNQLLLAGSLTEPHAAMMQAMAHRKPPVKTASPPCQEVIKEQNVDLTRMLPIPTLTPRDAGPYITLGVVLARDPETGARNASIHRLCVQGSDRMTIWINPGHHLGHFYQNAQKKGVNLPISINLGLDPAIYFAACFTEPLCAKGECELEIAGGLRDQAVHISDCRSIAAECISNAEIVLEGEITSEVCDENNANPAAASMPEFLGYDGAPKADLPIVRITAVTHRHDPIYHTLIGPGREQSELLGLPIEMATLGALRKQFDIDFKNAFFSSAGGGLLLLILQVGKKKEIDDQSIKEAAAMVLSMIPPLKQIILVDDDIDIHCAEDVFWALSTRFQADKDMRIFTDQAHFPMDPSQSIAYRRETSSSTGGTKSILDCTAPWRLKAQFRRSF